MLSEAQTLMFQAPLLAVWPGVAIALAVLGLNLLGDGLRDLLDPRLARKKMTPPESLRAFPLSTRCALWEGTQPSARKPYAACAGWRPLRGRPRNTPRQFHAQ